MDYKMKVISSIIKQNPELSYLFQDDYDKIYSYRDDLEGMGTTHIQKCILVADKYDFIIPYIKMYLKEYPYTIDFQNTDGMTALMLACSLSSVEIVNILIENHANINMTDNQNNTALMYACRYSSENFDLFKILINVDEKVNDYGNNALMVLCCEDIHNIDTVRLLIDRTTNLNHQNIYGNNALMLLIGLNDYNDSKLQIIKELLEKNIDINQVNKKNLNALDLCLMNPDPNKIDVIKLLLSHNIKINERVNGIPFPKLLHHLYDASKIDIEILKLLSCHCDKLNCVKNDTVVNLIYEKILSENEEKNKNECFKFTVKIFSCIVMYLTLFILSE